jgi:tellurite resistance protein TerC
VLFLGILGALIFRATFIIAGLALIQLFHWTVYVFGALLVFTAVRMLFAKEEAPELRDNMFVRLAQRFIPITNEYHGEKLVVRIHGKRYATPLMLALVVIETSDVIFAVDSVPAVLGVTQDPFIAFTSNVFAILGLRSLYFALAAVLSSFQYLKVSLVLVLGFVGAKMLLTHYLPIGSGVSLLIIVGLLASGVITSILAKRRTEPQKNAEAPSATSVERAQEKL